MTHYLTYWKEYWNDREEGYDVNPGWTTDSDAMHRTVKAGDSIWAVTRDEGETTSEWRLIFRVVVQNVDPKPSKTKWGRWHFKGDRKNSKRYSLRNQPDFTAILWLLRFASGNRIKVTGSQIGQALQTHGH